jgi:hypothetical protein
MLDSDATWLTPGNLHEYKTRAEVEESTPISAEHSVLVNYNNHPPLDSPEPSSQAEPRYDSQFHTQAPPMMDATQIKRKLEDKPGVLEEEDYEWDSTPPKQKDQRKTRAQDDEQVEPDNSFEWKATAINTVQDSEVDADFRIYLQQSTVTMNVSPHVESHQQVSLQLMMTNPRHKPWLPRRRSRKK